MRKGHASIIGGDKCGVARAEETKMKNGDS
jgi:hypothetical protein